MTAPPSAPAPPDAARYRRDGFLVLPETLPTEAVAALRAAVDRLPGGGARGGARFLLERCPAVRAWAGRPEWAGAAAALIGPGACAVRATLFDKRPGANWVVPRHRDAFVAVAERVETPGFTDWTIKAGVWHVRPPASTLRGMVALRIHLDDCGAASGPLRVVPGSHRSGFPDPPPTAARETAARETTLTVPPGGIVALSPAALHASGRTAGEARRRVIHVEYAAAPLPGGLRWAARVRPDAPAGPRPGGRFTGSTSSRPAPPAAARSRRRRSAA